MYGNGKFTTHNASESWLTSIRTMTKRPTRLSKKRILRIKIETGIGQALQAAEEWGEQAQTRLRSAPRRRGFCRYCEPERTISIVHPLSVWSAGSSGPCAYGHKCWQRPVRQCPTVAHRFSCPARCRSWLSSDRSSSAGRYRPEWKDTCAKCPTCSNSASAADRPRSLRCGRDRHHKCGDG